METVTLNKPRCPFRGRPQTLSNFESKKEVTDILHIKNDEPGVCSETVCNGSLMNIRRMSLESRAPSEVLSQAKQFLEEYYKNIKGFESKEHLARVQEVTRSVTRTGTYDLTYDELDFGTKLAWRNAPRCIGRISWSKLHLFDGRHVKTAKEMFDLMCKHLDYATNNGNIRSTITVFPQRRTGQLDFRVWNQQLIGFAGYEQPDGSVIGDPVAVEFTKVCQKLGWKGKGGRFDILPWVVNTPNGEPEVFEIPKEKVLTVPIEHPEHKWFKELNLEWFAVPAVSSMMLDCGGIQFTATPFNGWYMATEIGTRDFCDVQRYNMLPMIAEKLGLDTRTSINLWKDKATVEINVAVLHSFQKLGVTLVDHHTAAETFMQFHANEYRQRGGCPADWAWIVPPIGGSLTPVFHQEMTLYYLKPGYEYQISGWVALERQKKMLSGKAESNTERPIKKFRQAAMAVVFASTLYTGVLSRRVRVAVIYASETGKSQAFANSLAQIFSHSFNPKVICMADYDISELSTETMIAYVASTTGVGEPPVNGQELVKNLYELREKVASHGSGVKSVPFWDDYNDFKINGGSSSSTTSDNGIVDKKKLLYKRNRGLFARLVDRFLRRREYDTENPSNYMNGNGGSTYLSTVSLYKSSYSLGKSTNSLFRALDPASDVAYAVFALGSNNYKYFCAFGKYIDHIMYTLGGDRILDLTCGDETENQQEAFNSWSSELLKVCCERFHVENVAPNILTPDQITNSKQVRISERSESQPLSRDLSELHGKPIVTCKVVANNTLYQDRDKWYQEIVISADPEYYSSLKYEPGDHFGVLPANNPAMINGILSRLRNKACSDTPVQVLLQLKEGSGGWKPHPYLPVATIRTLLSRYLDITSPPSQPMLRLLADAASDEKQISRLLELATNGEEYREWKKWNYPNLLEVLREFPSVRIDVGLLLCRLPTLQPRLYSVSSSPNVREGQLTLTVASFSAKTQGGKGPLHQGVCTSYFKRLRSGDTIEIFHRSAPEFHLPEPTGKSVPVLLIGAGSGVAPLRGFWQHYHITGLPRDVTLYYGCQTRTCDLYAEEKEAMCKAKVLKNAHVALSRERAIPKAYVQDLLLTNGKDIYKQLVHKGGHIYLCGSEGMADGIQRILLSILQDHGGKSIDQAQKTLRKMKEEHRYHEDIFGSGSHA